MCTIFCLMSQYDSTFIFHYITDKSPSKPQSISPETPTSPYSKLFGPDVIISIQKSLKDLDGPRFIIILTCFLLFTNLLLIVRMGQLESQLKRMGSKSKGTVANLVTDGKTKEQWIQLVKQQDLLHQEEMEKLNQMRIVAQDLVRQVFEIKLYLIL